MFTDQRWVGFRPVLLRSPHPEGPGLQRRLLEPARARQLTADGGTLPRRRRAASVLSLQRLRSSQALSPQQASGRPATRFSSASTRCGANLRRVSRPASSARVSTSMAGKPYGWGTHGRGPAHGHADAAPLPGRRDCRRRRQGSRAARPVRPRRTPGAFLDWLNSPADDGPRRVSRYLYAIYRDRLDLQNPFSGCRRSRRARALPTGSGTTASTTR